jgi:hypothetical protein
MAFDQLISEINMLLSEMETQPQDQWELHEVILEKLNELRALGLPVPQDLVKLEERLSRELKQADRPE